VIGWADPDADPLGDLRRWADEAASRSGFRADDIYEAGVAVAKAYADPNRDLGDEIRAANRAERAWHVLVCIAVSPFGRPAGRHIDGAVAVLGTETPDRADWDRAAGWAREHYRR